MKTLKLNLIIALLTFLAPQFVHANTPDDPSSELRTIVIKMLDHCPISDSIDENVRISLFVTADEKLVVLKTDARSESLDSFIKTRMNYKRIHVKNLEANRVFTVKVHFLLN